MNLDIFITSFCGANTNSCTKSFTRNTKIADVYGTMILKVLANIYLIEK